MVPSIGKWEKTSIILSIIFGVLMLTCLILEFVNVPILVKQIVVSVTAVYALVCLIIFTLKKIYLSGNSSLIEIKNDKSPVTKADKMADKKIRKILSKNFPNYSLLTEESKDDKSTSVI